MGALASHLAVVASMVLGADGTLADAGHSARAVVRLAAVLFALGSFAVFVGAGGRRHAQPPVAVPTDPSDDEPPSRRPPSVSGSTTPAVVQPDTERHGAV